MIVNFKDIENEEDPKVIEKETSAKSFKPDKDYIAPNTQKQCIKSENKEVFADISNGKGHIVTPKKPQKLNVYNGDFIQLNQCPTSSNTEFDISTFIKYVQDLGLLQKRNYLSEFLTDEEKELVRINLKTDEYFSQYNDRITTQNEALDALFDKVFYKTPAAVSITPSITLYRNNTIVSNAYKGMILDKVIISWIINNYKDSTTVKCNGSTMLTNQYTLDGPIDSNKTILLEAVSSYIDSKGVSPQKYQTALSINFKNIAMYYETAIPDYTNFQDVANNLIITDKTEFNVDQSNNTGLKYIYILLPAQHKNINIYEKGSAEVKADDMTQYKGYVSIKKYDTEITYYVYRSTYSLKGNWMIKYYN